MREKLSEVHLGRMASDLYWETGKTFTVESDGDRFVLYSGNAPVWSIIADKSDQVSALRLPTRLLKPTPTFLDRCKVLHTVTDLSSRARFLRAFQNITDKKLRVTKSPSVDLTNVQKAVWWLDDVTFRRVYDLFFSERKI